VEQHLKALQQANLVRLARADLKRAIKAREVTAAEVLLGEIPDWLEEMRVEDLCNAVPRFSWRHFQRLMQEAKAGLALTVFGLTPRQRLVIAEWLAEWEVAADERHRARARRHRPRTDSVRRRAA